LQAILVLVLGFAAGFLYYESTFVTGMVHDQLAAQQIFFPERGTPALDPKTYPTLQQYAGQQVDNGEKAKAYAEDFLGHHLKGIFVDPSTGKGLTYAELGNYIKANPADTKAPAARETVFKGEMLRTALLNAWGWSKVGEITFYAAIGLTIAALGVLAALVFELYFVFVARRPRNLIAQRRAA
jgi:hypothetical protein